MSVVVLGLSHRSAPLAVLESVALSVDDVGRLQRAVLRGENVDEAVVLATCNRLEVYAESRTFHGAVVDIGEAVAEVTGVRLDLLREHLYVHYEDRAIAHVFTVACGLDSMAVGEAQVLGQLREALSRSVEAGPSPVLQPLFQQALRVGKRAHADTGIDAVSRSLVQTGLVMAAERLGPVEDLDVLVVGAGAMSGLAAATAGRAGARVSVVNRTAERAQRLAESVGGRALSWSELAPAVAGADVVLSCTGAVGTVLDASVVADRSDRPVVLLDLAMPHDVDPALHAVPGVTVVGLDQLGDRLAGDGQTAGHVREVQDLVVGEVAAYLTGRRELAVAPTVAALRSRAAEVTAVELARLDQRAPELSEHDRAEVHLAVHRVVEKLLHTPTVRVKQFAGNGSGDYAQALRELFDLDPHDVAAVSVPPSSGRLL